MDNKKELCKHYKDRRCILDDKLCCILFGGCCIDYEK